MKIAIDFDGTCVTHEYPEIGKEISAIPVLHQLVNKGHQLILFTMRHNQRLTDAINWFASNRIPLYGIQKDPGQEGWTASNKCYAELYIDDAALGCPLIYNDRARPYADWEQIETLLTQKGIL